MNKHALLLAIIAVIVVAVGALVFVLMNSGEEHLSVAYGTCSESSASDCRLILDNKTGTCGPCDLNDSAYACVTSNEYNRIKAEQEEYNKTVDPIQCAPCVYLDQKPHTNWRCVCDGGKCYKAEN